MDDDFFDEFALLLFIEYIRILELSLSEKQTESQVCCFS